MKAVIQVIIFVLFFSFNAQARVLPVFKSHPVKETLFLSSPTQVKNFRVLVFPHFGPYSVPEGRESSANQVLITSEQACELYIAHLDANLEWVKQGQKIRSDAEIHLIQGASQAAQERLYYHCEKPFTIHRALPLASISYAGDFVVLKDEKSLSVINVVDPEIYIKGVIPSEVETSWPVEVLKAQAVAARTYSWWTALNARKDITDYDMDDTVFYQAYQGMLKRTAISDQAVEETKSILLRYQGEVIKAYFSDDTGGYSEDSAAAFNEELPYCKAKKEIYDLSQVKSDWTKSISWVDLSTQLILAKVIPEGVGIQSVRVLDADRTVSGRADQVTVQASGGQIYKIKGPAFRLATKLRSSLFHVSLSADGKSAVFVGKGWGHGVGMAQEGALQYSKQLNWSFEQILKFYYSGVTL